jgi:hypothetical protein
MERSLVKHFCGAAAAQENTIPREWLDELQGAPIAIIEELEQGRSEDIVNYDHVWMPLQVSMSTQAALRTILLNYHIFCLPIRQSILLDESLGSASERFEERHIQNPE